MFKHLDVQQSNKVKDAMFLVEHKPGDVVIRAGKASFRCADYALGHENGADSILIATRALTKMLGLPYFRISPGDPGDNFYLIDQGSFDVFISKGGEEKKV